MPIFPNIIAGNREEALYQMPSFTELFKVRRRKATGTRHGAPLSDILKP
jgi:hypothetical protein